MMKKKTSLCLWLWLLALVLVSMAALGSARDGLVLGPNANFVSLADLDRPALDGSTGMGRRERTRARRERTRERTRERRSGVNPGSLTSIMSGSQVILSTNAEVVAFAKTAGSVFDGSILIREAVTSLQSLENLTQVGGYFQIGDLGYNTQLESLDGLQQLASIGGDLQIGGFGAAVPPELSLVALEGLNYVGGRLFIENTALPSLDGLENLNSIGGDLVLTSNTKLTSIADLKSVTSIGGTLTIKNSERLTSLDGLEGLVSVVEDVDIDQAQALASLDGLKNLKTVDGNLKIGSQLL